MKVILMENVKGTGKAGDVVEVSDGFARNRLLPKKLAKEATSGNLKNLEKQKEVQAEKDAEAKREAEKTAQRLEKVTLELSSKGGEGGKLFGSITSKDISKALKKQQNIEVDKKKVLLDSPIKNAGSHRVKVKLYGGITADVNLQVSIEE
jgi:large subunit ribosomal protein L9